MKILNDHKGEINGKVMLNYQDCTQLVSALFYLMREEKREDELESLKVLKGQLKAILTAFDADYDYGDYQGTFG
jgi:hypothetical protein